MNENQEIVETPSFETAMVRQPEAVLAEARKAALALQSILKGKVHPIIFNKEQYIEFEDWQLLGKFYGLTAKVVSTTEVNIGGARGYEAKAVAVDTRTGIEVSAAEAMCINDEETWSLRTKYEWKNGVKVAVGTMPVPMFQLRSMAQTRACAKALRNVLAWVVVLAGYKPTPAEEMTGDEKPSTQQTKPPVPMPQSTTTVDKISDKQSKRFYAIAKNKGKTDAEIKAYLKSKIGSEHTRDIPWKLYEEICLWADPSLVDESPEDSE